MVKFCLLILTLCFSVFSFASAEPFKILVLSSFHETLPWSESFRKGIFAAESEYQHNIQLYFESLDFIRTSDIVSAEERKNILSIKYSRLGIDAVIVDSDDADRLISEYGEEIFGKIPFVIYSSGVKNNNINFQYLVPHTKEAIKGTLDMIVRHNKKVETIYIVTSRYATSVTGLEYIKSIQSDYRGISLEIINDYSFEELYSRVSRLDKKSAILYQLTFRDKTGESDIPKNIAVNIASKANVPVYAYYGSFLGSGVIGGVMIDGYTTASNMVKTAMAMVAGEPVKPEYLKTAKKYIDWSQAVRFDLDIKNESPDTVYINRPLR